MPAAASFALQAALVVLAIFALGGLPLAFVGVLAPLAFLAGVRTISAAARPGIRAGQVRSGRRLLALLLVSSVASFFESRGDWVHSLWSVQYPIVGLLFGSGLLLVPGGASGMKIEPGGRGLTVAFVAALALGLLPLLLIVLPFESRTLARESVPLVETFFEVVAYGFGGGVPGAMEPLSVQDIERGLKVPPRIVTVTMASTFLAAIAWTLLALVALFSRAFRSDRLRERFVLLAPAGIAALAFIPTVLDWGRNMNRVLYRGIWRNEPWFANAYGPVLLVAALITLLLLFTRRRTSQAS